MRAGVTMLTSVFEGMALDEGASQPLVPPELQSIFDRHKAEREHRRLHPVVTPKSNDWLFPWIQQQRRYCWVARCTIEGIAAERVLFFTGSFRYDPKKYDKAADETQDFIERLRKSYPRAYNRDQRKLYQKRCQKARDAAPYGKKAEAANAVAKPVYLKGEDAPQFRYFWCVEKSNKNTKRFHVHFLFFAQKIMQVKYITSQWKCGITHCELVKDHARCAGYIAKYTTKEFTVDGRTGKRKFFRCKASIGFGQIHIPGLDLAKIPYHRTYRNWFMKWAFFPKAKETVPGLWGLGFVGSPTSDARGYRAFRLAIKGAPAGKSYFSAGLGGVVQRSGAVFRKDWSKETDHFDLAEPRQYYFTDGDSGLASQKGVPPAPKGKKKSEPLPEARPRKPEKAPEPVKVPDHIKVFTETIGRPPLDERSALSRKRKIPKEKMGLAARSNRTVRAIAQQRAYAAAMGSPHET